MKTMFSSKWGLPLQIVLISLWSAQLLYTDAYYVNYLLVMTIASICCYRNSRLGERLEKELKDKHMNVIVHLYALAFSAMVTMSNYSIWRYHPYSEGLIGSHGRLYSIIWLLIFAFGGYFAFWNIFHVLAAKINALTWKQSSQCPRPIRAFAISFLSLMVTRLIVLFYSQYPGVLAYDSITQMSQILSGRYTNHHPYYHTMTIKLFVSLGMSIFHDLEAGIATFSVFQILFTSACFSYAVSTLAKMTAPKWTVISACLFFLLMPYHILYAITMWKDVMFGCFVLLLVTSLVRLLNTAERGRIDYVILAISGLGTCLYRSNGLLAFMLLVLAFGAIWKLKERKIFVILLLALISGLVLKHSVLSQLHIPQPDIMESLSIPAQQIARVVCEGGELNDWERETLGAVVEIDFIPQNYKTWLADPMKEMVWHKGNQHLIAENKLDYIKLYLSLGLRYPGAYIRAWIDQTKGYWNAGYDDYRWETGVLVNDLGIEGSIRNLWFDQALKKYCGLFMEIHFLRLFLSIGPFIWADMLALMVALLRKDKLGAFVSLPVLSIVLTLLLATPLVAEVRYIYSAFCTLPIVLVTVLRPTQDFDWRQQWTK